MRFIGPTGTTVCFLAAFISSSLAHSFNHSVGLVMTSGAKNLANPSSASMVNAKSVLWYNWGHTAITILRDNHVIRTIGFGPVELNLLRLDRIKDGSESVFGQFADDNSLFELKESFLIEWEISEEESAYK